MNKSILNWLPDWFKFPDIAVYNVDTWGCSFGHEYVIRLYCKCFVGAVIS